MSTLVLARSFLPTFGGLPKDVQKKVNKLLEVFQEHTHAGVHLEKPNAVADPRARTVRVDQFWRGVVAAVGGSDDRHVLVDVMPHDDAYAWCERNVFEVNPATGAFEITDVEAIQDFARTRPATEPADKPLLEGVPDKHFTQLGIPDGVLPLARTVDSDEELEALAALLPDNQADALRGLAAGLAPETIYGELIAGEDPGDVDTEDLSTAVERPASGSMFYVVQDAADLEEVLNQPFELWRVFLHPNQRRLAYKTTFNGPAKVTGGAGTGKTVVAMHRAKYLAERAGDDDRILLTTFTKNLAANLETAFKDLAKSVANRVEINNVDSLAHQVVREAEGGQPRIATRPEAEWRAAAADAGVADLTPEFLSNEYDHIILGNDIRNRDAYFQVERAGQGVPLDRRGRAHVWKVVEGFEARLHRAGRRTFLQLTRDALDHLRQTGPRYRHVIIDEAQDLHPLQWLMLRAATTEAENDLFLVGDSHQRIYDRRVSLRSLGIHVVGRSHRLRLNYRTTEEILRWSAQLLTGLSYDDLDGGVDSLAGYTSTLHGPAPTARGYSERSDELVGLAEAVQAWRDSGVAEENIAVAARTKKVVADAANGLRTLGFRVADLDADRPGPGIRVGTMHRMKGLEFRCVAVVGVEEGLVPLPYAVCRQDDDPAQHDRDLQRERCLLFVACTRARDDLRLTWSGSASPFVRPVLEGAPA